MTAPPRGVKNVEFVTRKPGLAVDEFQRYWREIHGPLAAQIPVIRRYVQSHTRTSAYERVLPHLDLSPGKRGAGLKTRDMS